MRASITFIGDTLLGGDDQGTLDREGYAHAFDGLAPLLADTDLVVANHEGPITRVDRREQGLQRGEEAPLVPGLS